MDLDKLKQKVIELYDSLSVSRYFCIVEARILLAPKKLARFRSTSELRTRK